MYLLKVSSFFAAMFLFFGKGGLRPLEDFANDAIRFASGYVTKELSSCNGWSSLQIRDI